MQVSTCRPLCELAAAVAILAAVGCWSSNLIPSSCNLQSSAPQTQRRQPTQCATTGDCAARAVARFVCSPWRRSEAADHQKLYRKAATMIKSSDDGVQHRVRADQYSQAYGEEEFASGCLLARRLVETGVPFVEVLHNGWDTHDDNFARTKTLCGQIDQPVAALIRDLKQRGLLETTLVVWMGEFGRTPKINARGGRDHFPKAFNVALAGGGVRGGQVIGQTDASGGSVLERPVTVPDLFQSFCKSLGVNPTVENVGPNGRPIRLSTQDRPLPSFSAS